MNGRALTDTLTNPTSRPIRGVLAECYITGRRWFTNLHQYCCSSVITPHSYLLSYDSSFKHFALIVSDLRAMSYSNTSYGFFPSTPSSPNAFNLFIAPQSPRDTHATYEDLRQVLRPSNRPTSYEPRSRSSSTSSIKLGLKKFLGGNI